MCNAKAFIFSLFIYSVLSANTIEEGISNGFCDAKGSCSESDEKYLLFDVNPPEGFNLRRDVYMRFAIMLAEARKKENKRNWNLVLPPWYNLYHWKNDGYMSKPMPWNKFFDMNAMKTFAPVLDLYEVFQKTDAKKLHIDRVYALQNFEEPFGPNGEFIDKWEVNNNCVYNGYYWDYDNITVGEVVCVKFQGRISKLWEVIMLHPNDKFVMFDNGEIPLHNYYGDRNFWNCRKSMKYNKNLVARAKRYMENDLNCHKEKCDNYVSVHWRRQDFARSRKKEVPSIEGTAKQLNESIKLHTQDIVNIFIATDAAENERNTLVKLLEEMTFKVHLYLPSKEDFLQYRDGGIAIIDQIICAHAAFFIGTHDSTFTFRIYEEREIIGFEPHTTFNRLCPDKGRCEKPSVWKIVQ